VAPTGKRAFAGSPGSIRSKRNKVMLARAREISRKEILRIKYLSNLYPRLHLLSLM